MNLEQIRELEISLPPIVARTAVPGLTAGMLSAGRMANLDSMGQGPRKIKAGRKVAYTRNDFIKWLASRCGSTGEAA